MAIRAAVTVGDAIVDANESRQAEGLAARCQLLADLGVAMLEQPLPAGDARCAGAFIRCRSAPMKSCHTRADLPRLAQRYQMINIKLDKTGGLTEALALAQAAREQAGSPSCSAACCARRDIRHLAAGAGGALRRSGRPDLAARDVEPGLAFECGAIVISPRKD
ncbi:hypothetical protein M8494_09220 [Serratia ureilytica]